MKNSHLWKSTEENQLKKIKSHDLSVAKIQDVENPISSCLIWRRMLEFIQERDHSSVLLLTVIQLLPGTFYCERIWVGGNFNPKSADFFTFYPPKVQILPIFSQKSANFDNWKWKIEGNFFTHHGKNKFFWQNINLWYHTKKKIIIKIILGTT